MSRDEPAGGKHELHEYEEGRSERDFYRVYEKVTGLMAPSPRRFSRPRHLKRGEKE